MPISWGNDRKKANIPNIQFCFDILYQAERSWNCKQTKRPDRETKFTAGKEASKGFLLYESNISGLNKSHLMTQTQFTNMTKNQVLIFEKLGRMIEDKDKKIVLIFKKYSRF